MGEPNKKQASKWKLAYVPEPVEPLPGVAEVRARWLGKWALLRVRVAPEKWTRVKIYRVTNDGAVLFGVVRQGVFLPWAALEMKHVPLLLRPLGK